MDIILYSTNCPKCAVLKKKLDLNNINYTINDNVDTMVELGISTVPILSVNGNLLSFTEAVNWINNNEV